MCLLKRLDMEERAVNLLTIFDQLCDFLVVSIEHIDCLHPESRGKRVNGRPRRTASAHDHCCLKFLIMQSPSIVNALQRLLDTDSTRAIPAKSTLSIKIHDIDSTQHPRCIVEMIQRTS